MAFAAVPTIVAALLTVDLAMTRPIPGYFFPLLSGDDQLCDGALGEMTTELRTTAAVRRPTLVYIHVPYCRSTCSFCGYYRQTNGREDSPLAAYVDRVLAELAVWQTIDLERLIDIQAVYVGGGTPSLLAPELAKRLLSGIRAALGLPKGLELSFEGEPGTLKNDALLEVLREQGVTRCSFGVQSFEPGVRKLCSIAATLGDVEQCIGALRRHGYALNLDLMYGLPGQTPAGFAADLRRAVETEDAALIDLYPTVLYPSAPLYRRDRAARAQLPSDADRDEMYELALEYFERQGFRQYTFEDFCRPGHEYLMKDLTYGGSDGMAQTLALGACAVGYIGGYAYRNAMIDPYHAADESRLPIALLRRASLDERRRRAMFFYPRRLRAEPTQLSIPLGESELLLLEQQIEGGLATRRADGTIELTRQGRKASDDIVVGFLQPEERRKIFRLVQ